MMVDVEEITNDKIGNPILSFHYKNKHYLGLAYPKIKKKGVKL